MGAVLQLERFDLRASPPEPPPPASADLDAAFARGLAAGRDEARALQLDRLSAALDDLSSQLGVAAARDRQDRDAATVALRPLFAALLDGVMPQIAQARLEAALLSELTQLADAVSPLRASIRCGPDLAPFLAACVAQTGFDAVEIDATAPDGTAEAELLGGRITWDVATVTRQLSELVHDIMEGK